MNNYRLYKFIIRNRTKRKDLHKLYFQQARKEKTNADLLALIITNNLGQTEFFINKAIGWSLRDYSKTNPQWVRAFIEKYREQLAPLSIREVSKYLLGFAITKLCSLV
ncbi:MAG TPA: DNA alkylation repair protein [Candidatus Paenibacillus intestinavium]|nr:DNA alkylation repair protein [Candidatus Paenibacillus intestinavium]